MKHDKQKGSGSMSNRSSSDSSMSRRENTRMPSEGYQGSTGSISGNRSESDSSSSMDRERDVESSSSWGSTDRERD